MRNVYPEDEEEIVTDSEEIYIEGERERKRERGRNDRFSVRNSSR